MKLKKIVWSNEYIKNTLINETIKLVNLRCLDLGYVPYNQDNQYAKAWGPPFFAT